ncbi:MAG: HNH endonuclease [Bacteroidales bacterium]|nr:HNH endonuclease [Bacteroidales bacterium]
MSNTKVKNFWDEEWKDLVFDNLKEKSKYKISNYGRILSFYYHKDGKLVSSTSSAGYKIFLIKDKDGKTIRRYVHRLVAMYFLDKPREDQNQVIHLDNNKGNNYYKNLEWASEKEKRAHQDKMQPGWHQLGNYGRRKYAKLTETQVKLIKRKINDPNRKTRMKMIAKRYGISVMQLYRIKSGENWGTVNPD